MSDNYESDDEMAQHNVVEYLQKRVRECPAEPLFARELEIEQAKLRRSEESAVTVPSVTLDQQMVNYFRTRLTSDELHVYRNSSEVDLSDLNTSKKYIAWTLSVC